MSVNSRLKATKIIGQIYLDKPAAESCRFIYVNMTF